MVGYKLLRAADGFFLNSLLETSRTAGDECMWKLIRSDEQTIVLLPADAWNRSSELELKAKKITAKQDHGATEVGELGIRVVLSSVAAAVQGEFKLIDGPKRLPSEYLQDLESKGWTVLDGVVHADSIKQLRGCMERLRAAGAPYENTTGRPYDGRAGLPHMASESPVVARAAVQPVALWLIQQYLGVDKLKLSHAPSVTILKPANAWKGTLRKNGWHVDYPYRPGRFPHDKWPDNIRLGVQFNVCISEFSAGNGSTQYIPGSHMRPSNVPEDFNTTPTNPGVGVHRQVTQWSAPAGAAIIYDARMWHRACPELNISGQERLAILNCVLPAWIDPMIEREAELDLFTHSDAAKALTQREQEEFAVMMGRGDEFSNNASKVNRQVATRLRSGENELPAHLYTTDDTGSIPGIRRSRL